MDVGEQVLLSPLRPLKSQQMIGQEAMRYGSRHWEMTSVEESCTDLGMK